MSLYGLNKLKGLGMFEHEVQILLCLSKKKKVINKELGDILI